MARWLAGTGLWRVHLNREAILTTLLDGGCVYYGAPVIGERVDASLGFTLVTRDRDRGNANPVFRCSVTPTGTFSCSLSRWFLWCIFPNKHAVNCQLFASNTLFIQVKHHTAGSQVAERLGTGFDSWPCPTTLCRWARHFTLLASGECNCTYCKSLWIRASAK